MSNYNNRKATFHVQIPNSNSLAHNSRLISPKYLIGFELNDENYYELIQSDERFTAEAKEIYKDKIHQKMQLKQVISLIKETALTVKKETTVKDVKNLFSLLAKKYGGHEILEISCHRDEGYFIRNSIPYYHTQDILKKGNEWFIKEDEENESVNADDFTVKVNIEDFERIYNYHFHVKFTMFDKSTGKTSRMQKKDMQTRLYFVSQHLGLAYNPGRVRHISRTVSQVKDEHHFARQRNIRILSDKLAQEKTLNEEKYNIIRETLRPIYSCVNMIQSQPHEEMRISEVKEHIITVINNAHKDILMLQKENDILKTKNMQLNLQNNEKVYTEDEDYNIIHKANIKTAKDGDYIKNIEEIEAEKRYYSGNYYLNNEIQFKRKI